MLFLVHMVSYVVIKFDIFYSFWKAVNPETGAEVADNEVWFCQPVIIIVTVNLSKIQHTCVSTLLENRIVFVFQPS